MHELWIAFAGGTLAFAHCLGMCGGFVLHLSHSGSRGAAFQRQLLWHAGRLFTYVFLGAIAGFAGALLTGAPHWVWTQRALTWTTGIVTILAGLFLLGALPGVGRRASDSGLAVLLASAFRDLFQQPTRSGAVILGAATGFLPCPIVVGFLALAAQSESAASGMAIMAAMGLGTIWALLALGLTGRLLSASFRRWGSVTGGILLLLLGTATLLRGTDAWHRVLGCPGAESGCCHETSP